jgi:hypothetical protein
MPASTRTVAGFVQREPQPDPDVKQNTQDIANLAYSLWQQRGCPEGSPEQDWLEAEKLVGTGQEK